jgi:NAD(P)-dependent dehydrogenase (short-subunit alcohol dehydrogenase family)
MSDFKTNSIGPVLLFQAVHDLLDLSTNEHGGIFLAISTAVASIGQPIPEINSAAYSTSKTALNYIVKRISVEHPNIIAVAVQWVFLAV